MHYSLGTSLRNQKIYIDSSIKSISMKHFHLHDDFEIYFLIEGERIFLIEDHQFTLKKGHLLFIDRNILHRFLNAENPEHSRIVINFKEDFIKDLPIKHLIHHLFEKGILLFKLDNEMYESIYHLTQKFCQEYEAKNKNFDLFQQGLLLQLFVYADRLLQKEETICLDLKNNTAFSNQRMAEILMYINNNFMKSVTLTDIANKFYLSVYYLSRMFKEMTGYTFKEYLNNIRIHHTQIYLDDNQLKINEIAYKVGFSTPSHFNRVFKSITGCSPSEYRSRQKNTKAANRSHK